MQFTRTVLSGVALLALSVWSGQGIAAVDPAGITARGLEINSPLKLDAKSLMGMKAGQKVEISFPYIGKKTVVFETTTKGLDGLNYWHGSLDGSPRDRVFLKQVKEGFVGAVRFSGHQLAFRQQPSGELKAVQDVGPIHGQAYALGATTDKGVRDLKGNFAGLAQAEEGAEIALPLPNGQIEVAIVTHRELDQDGFVQIQGVSRMDGAGSPTVVTVGKDAVFGTVMSNGNEYQIITRQGKTQIVDPVTAGWNRLRGPDHVDAGEVDEPQAAAGILKKVPVAAAPVIPVPLVAGKIDTTITLFMTYSASYVSQWGTEAVARTRLSNLVQLANSAYANSGTGIAFKIVGWAKVAQADTTPQVVLPAMRADSGSFKGVAAQRRATGGAMTVFFAPFNTVTSKTNTCGLAYVPGGGAGGMNLFKAQVGTAMFAALNDGQANGYYCEMLSLAHELGHNLGNSHDKANSSFAGVFNYSYGKGVSGQFGTVMSYISPRVALFSSPKLTCTASKQPCGSDTENVVATMLQTKGTVAALGNAGKASASTEGSTVVAGWLLNANGTPFTTAATVKATDARITCGSGTTGLYVCTVPNSIGSVALSVAAAGKVAAPALGSFTVDRSSNTPVNGTRFYLSAAPAPAKSTAKK
ncbi:reprolysin-like metallopeptidase [Aquabacterium sp.]|uniref:reprolysin-like metallopeptidase n=1 Tax=Aquabacterium sp. TaxID=1872578 RepID=UPI0025BC539F|nr:M12 family metallo-peptidase [Aquabacterium sp.]